jgi:hypothetical protein
MKDRKYYLWFIPGVLVLGMVLALVFTFQPVFAGSAQSALSASNEGNLNSINAPSEVVVPQVDMDPACPLDVTNAISHWPLNETSGTTFDDVLVGDHNGTCTGDSCPSTISGTNAGGQFFVETDPDAITVPTSTDFDFATTDSFSAGIWVKTTQNCTDNKVFIGRYRNLTEEGRWWLGCEQSGGVGVARFHMRDSNGNARSAVGTEINDGKWHYLTGVWDGTDTKLYVDGSLKASVGSPPFTGNFTSTEPLTIGAYDEDTAGYYVTGALDEAAVFNVALDTSFISTYIGKCGFDIDVGDVTFDTSKNVAIPILESQLLANSPGLTLNSVDSSSKYGGSITGTAPNFLYTPKTDYVGTDFFTFEDTNGGVTARGTAIITQEIPLAINPGPQTDYEGAAVSLQIEAIDAYGDDLTYEVTGLPGFPPGLSIGAATGLITGNVAPGSAGLYDPVKIRVKDHKGYSVQIEFPWTIDANQIPEVTPIPNQSNAVGETITPLQVAATDGDTDILTYDVVNLPPGLSIHGASGQITGTVSAGAASASPYSVVVTVSDGKAAPVEAPFTWTISGENLPPVVTKPDNQANFEGDTISLQVAATDPNGDVLTYSATGLPPGLSINPTTGLISGPISAGASAFSPFSVEVKATDPGTLFDAETFTWTVSTAKYIFLPVIFKTYP